MKPQSVFYGLIACLFLSACSHQLVVDGCIESAEGRTLYFEHNKLSGHQLIDSVQLSAKGKFRFKTSAPDQPSFYRLRLGQQSIHLTAKQAATISVFSQAESFNRHYRVEGSNDCLQLQALTELQRECAARYDSLHQLADEGKLSTEAFVDSALVCIGDYKQQARRYILDDPSSAVAYFALYQRIHKLLLFNPYHKEDNKLFSAVATSWEIYYPTSERTSNLKHLTLSGQKELRSQRKSLGDIPIQEIDHLPLFEIVLPNIFGEEVALSSLKGKVVLLDFTAFQTDYSAQRTLNMREWYNEFERYGFEIYQVSLDPDEHFWKTAALNLPWICVRDKNLFNSIHLSRYHVQQLPSFFLINKQGNLVGRDETIGDLRAEIIRLLKE